MDWSHHTQVIGALAADWSIGYHSLSAFDGNECLNERSGTAIFRSYSISRKPHRSTSSHVCIRMANAVAPETSSTSRSVPLEL